VPPCHELRSADGLRRDDRGFTLIEVLIAFFVIAIVATSATTLTIRGMRATMEAQHLTQAKNLVNAQIETMRGLPFFVSRGTSAAAVDLLDKYYPNIAGTTPSPNCAADATTWLTNKSTWSGYVPAASTARCAFEPATGSFYRTVVDPVLASGSVPTALVVTTQFLGLASGEGTAAPAVTPATGYSSTDTADKDRPATNQVAAQVTALWGAAGSVKSSTSRTDIADRRGGPALVSAETNAAALVVDGSLASGERRRLELGTVSGEGGLTVVTKAAVEAVGGSMQSDSGRVDGAAQVASAPGTLSGPSVGSALTSGTLSIGATKTSGVAASNSVSDPGFGNAVGSAAAGSFSLDQARPGLGLTTADPLIAVSSGGVGATSSAGTCPAASGYEAFGAGFMNTGVGSPTSLDACAQTEAATIKLFPIAGSAPDGLLQVRATDIVARCQISGNTPSATMAGTVALRWLATAPSTYSAWTTLTLSGTTVSGSLPPLATVLGNGKTIGDYITSWSAFSGVDRVQTFDATTNVRATSAKVPAALSLATAPIRLLPDATPDPDSAVKVVIGRATASAMDRR
jgi:prepilin-type N-terminal cleavage/methylation domain-containing protein